LNRRIFTLEIVEQICRSEKIDLIRDPSLLWPGVYLVRRKKPRIFYDAALRGVDLLKTILHELGHHFQHAPQMCFYDPSSLTKAEYQAETFTAFALMPLALIKTKTVLELIEEFDYPHDLIAHRKDLFELYRQ
jgi:Zn-dependent peptidase ImmA (M78 family)